MLQRSRTWCAGPSVILRARGARRAPAMTILCNSASTRHASLSGRQPTAEPVPLEPLCPRMLRRHVARYTLWQLTASFRRFSEAAPRHKLHADPTFTGDDRQRDRKSSDISCSCLTEYARTRSMLDRPWSRVRPLPWPFVSGRQTTPETSEPTTETGWAPPSCPYDGDGGD
jgi:hypothetical protein